MKNVLFIFAFIFSISFLNAQTSKDKRIAEVTQKIESLQQQQKKIDAQLAKLYKEKVDLQDEKISEMQANAS